MLSPSKPETNWLLNVQEALHGAASKPHCFGSQSGSPGVTALGFAWFQAAASQIARIDPELLRTVVRVEPEHGLFSCLAFDVLLLTAARL